ncbi:MAG TPA: M20 family metallopeptidase [Kofleriaceae bacterium]|nr:M20 family metallopeptidase [Kofleriaceae bacterium]
MAHAERAHAIIDRTEGESMPLLERWVRINSFTANVEGVNRMATALEEGFDGIGLACERRAGERVGDHLVWRTAAWEDAAPSTRVVLIGHHDTVFPPGAFEVFERQGDRARGPGILDMKGGLIVVRSALRALHELGELARLPLALVSVADEEIGSPDSMALLEAVSRGARAALVFESGRSDDGIVTRRKGTGNLAVSARGRAAHAGNAHTEGVNAIWLLSRLIDRMQRLTDYDRGVTINVGTITGGEAKNTVPAAATCGVDFRFLTAADGHATVAAIDRAARELCAETPGGTITLEGGVRRQPLERTDSSEQLFRLYAQCAAPHGLGVGEAPIQGGGSDANTVSAIGVPAIDGLGPRGRGFHTYDEYIEVPTLVTRAKALSSTLLALTP